MKKYKVNGTIYCDIEVEADSETEAVRKFKAKHSYQHDSGMNVSPEVTSIAMEDEDEPKGEVSVYVGHSRVMYFDLDSMELIICLRDKIISIPPHRLDILWEWVSKCEDYYNETTEVDKMKDLIL